MYKLYTITKQGKGQTPSLPCWSDSSLSLPAHHVSPTCRGSCSLAVGWDCFLSVEEQGNVGKGVALVISTSRAEPCRWALLCLLPNSITLGHQVCRGSSQCHGTALAVGNGSLALWLTRGLTCEMGPGCPWVHRALWNSTGEVFGEEFQVLNSV